MQIEAFGQDVFSLRSRRLIAQTGIEHLQQSGLNLKLLQHYQWCRSLNARVPEFQ